MTDRTKQALLDVLRQWQYAERNDDAEELANARRNRDYAIAGALTSPDCLNGSPASTDDGQVNKERPHD